MANELKNTRMIYGVNDIYYNTPTKDDLFLSFYEPRPISTDVSDLWIVVEKRHEFRPYVLSYDLYANNRLWWVFSRLNMNELIDPIRDMREGLVLRVPTPERMSQLFTG